MPLSRAAVSTCSRVTLAVLTGMVGWHDGMRHWNTGATVFAPVGQYDPATINPATRQADVLSIGKNVWAIQPFVAGT